MGGKKKRGGGEEKREAEGDEEGSHVSHDKFKLTGYQGCDYIKQLRVVPQQQSVHNTFQHVHLH